MPLEGHARIVAELTSRGYNAERAAVTLLANADDTDRAIELAIAAAPDDALKLTESHVRTAVDGGTPGPRSTAGPGDDGSPEPPRPSDDSRGTPTDPGDGDRNGERDPPVSTGTSPAKSDDGGGSVPVETEGSAGGTGAGEKRTGTATEFDGSTTAEGGGSATTEDRRPTTTGEGGSPTTTEADGATPTTAEGGSPPATGADGATSTGGRSPVEPRIDDDVTGRSTGTGKYGDFVRVFRDRYERLASQLRGRVNARPTEALREMPGREEAAVIGMIDDIRSTASGHWLIDLEDTTGTFPALVMKDREFSDRVDELLHDEVIAVEGTLSDDAGILFVDAIHFPEVPRNYRPSTADREVQAALVSDVHVGSQEFRADAWKRFADWLHTPEAARVEYLLIAGDMVEGVGVYPDQDEELDLVDIYEQYETFAEHLKDVPGDLEVVMIPGNHDAVRLAEPQPGFDEELRGIMSAHDATITSNPSVVTIEGVSVLMYHGVSLDEVIAEFPEEKASYEEPHLAMNHLLKKRHVAPKYGGKLRLAPEEKDYLVVDDVPDVFHTGHVHKLGVGSYRNVRTINSGCWQAQTAFQKSVNIDPDVGFAPIVDLHTLDVTVRKFT